MGLRGYCYAWFAIVLIACGGKDGVTPDAGDPDAPTARCGNFTVEDGENCDDGNAMLDNVCDATCHYTCGNGVVDDTVGEGCDTAIPSGAGACPAACNDGDACTTDVLVGSECTAFCITSPVTVAADGDGCCPAGANANTDSDCTAMCGNGIKEAGEACDTGITGGAGACPTACNDGQACTTDTLTGAGSCAATCTATPITTPINGDTCCPPGANASNDTDCLASCGNGIKEPAETCDTAIAAGMTGSCPTTCNDNVACTSNVLSNGGTCTAACSYPAITMAINGDGCCPPGANANTDNDCTPVCPNGVIEGTEACDDGNMNNLDACSNTCTINPLPTAFRFNTLALKDPHAFATILFGCSDITNSAFGNAVNEQFTTNLNNDGNGDGYLDLSPTVVFRPLDQGAGATSPLEIHFANCTPPVATTMCKPGADPPILLTATNMTAGQCLGTIAGTVRPYNPAVTASTGPCFVSGVAPSVTINLAGVAIVMHDAQVAATYVGNPASNVVNGLLRGFITEADANATIFPATTAVVGGHALSYILPGGDPPGPDKCCSTNDDRDINNGVSGWWFYLNFTAPRTTWSDN